MKQIAQGLDSVNSVVVNTELSTGEKTVVGVNKRMDEGHYVKLYFKDIGALYGLSKIDTDVFFLIAKELEFGDDTNTVSLVIYLKHKIANKLEINVRTIDKCISVLIKRNLLIKTDFRALYVVNPKICTRNAFGKIARIIMHITYDKQGRTFNVDLKEINKIINELKKE